MRNFLKGTLKLFLFIGLFCVILALVMNVLVFKQEDGVAYDVAYEKVIEIAGGARK